MKKIRQLHYYLGALFAPAIFFFAFSGALQTFGLHESEAGEAYQPPAWIVSLAGIHKDQSLAKPHKEHKEHSTDADQPGHAPDMAPPEPQPAQHSPLPLKIFVLALAIGLMCTTMLGIYMAFQNRQNRRVTWAMLMLGVLIPVALLYL